MGRPSKPRRDKKGTISLSLSKELIRRIDDCRKVRGYTRTKFLETLIETALFSDKAFASYMIHEKKLEVSYWEWQFNKADAKAKLEREQMAIGDYER